MRFWTLLWLILPATAALADDPFKRDPERFCSAANLLTADGDGARQMWPADADLTEMMCSLAIVVVSRAMKGEPHAQCDELRLALASEARRRDLDLKAVGQECSERINRKKN